MPDVSLQRMMSLLAREENVMNWRHLAQRKGIRYFSSYGIDLKLDTDFLSNTITAHGPKVAENLSQVGYYTTTNFLPLKSIQAMRDQSIALREQGRFEQSWSEKIINGSAVRFDKKGVFACEPDGQDYYTAPDLITYMSSLLKTLPSVLNDQSSLMDMDLSNQSFNAKLAVTCRGGSYPLHIDNPQGISVGDTRKLTCILYLNPNYKREDGGELRLYLSDDSNHLSSVDIAPEGGRLLLFWSDEIPHEVLPNAPNVVDDDDRFDRYALTVWIPTSNHSMIHNAASKFRNLKDLSFP